MGRGMRGTFARTFTALTQSVLLYGCVAWALSPGELERLEVVQRGMLRQALPLARRREVGTVAWSSTSSSTCHFRVIATSFYL